MTKHTPDPIQTDLQLLTLEEVAKILRVTPKHVKRLYYGKQLEGVKIGAQLRFTRKAVEDWIAASTQKAPSKVPSNVRPTKKGQSRTLSPLPHSA
jgi:excisionase family DNA binding protein